MKKILILLGIIIFIFIIVLGLSIHYHKTSRENMPEQQTYPTIPKIDNFFKIKKVKIYNKYWQISFLFIQYLRLMKGGKIWKRNIKKKTKK